MKRHVFTPHSMLGRGVIPQLKLDDALRHSRSQVDRHDGWARRRLSGKDYCKRILSGEAMVYVLALNKCLREDDYGYAISGIAQFSAHGWSSDSR